MTATLPFGAPADDGAPAFRLADPLPDGVTLLEASAGTGKTHTIASLAVRYLAEGDFSIDQLLVVTFTRSATGELRSRVRARLLDAEAGLTARLAGDDGPADELVDLLAAGGEAEARRRLVHLRAAAADFDAATITTIHGFCEQVLGGLGTAADCGRDLQFVEDLQDLTAEVVDDFYVRKFRGHEEPPLRRRDAWAIVWKAVTNRDARLLPEPVGDSTAAMRSSLAHRAREEVVARARRAGLIAYDDQLARLCSTLSGPLGPAAVSRLQDRYRVVLVDEFQDTDPLQWQIFRTAFARSGSPLLLIGDPKQAIYSFRGADVWTYLAAGSQAAHQATLRTNWRTDQPLLDALDVVMGGVTLGHPQIPFRQVEAVTAHKDAGLAGSPVTTPLRLRLVHRGDGRLDVTRTGWARTGTAREVIARDLADDVAALLSSGATTRDGHDAWRPVRPGDIAVLVRTNREAATVRNAVIGAGIPAVIAGGGSVYQEEAATAWLTLLEALEQPTNQSRTRAAALTPFVGWDVAHLDGATDDEIDDLQADVHRWAAVLAGAGVAALYEAIAGEAGLVAAELRRPAGERRLTDLGHVAELLHADALATGAGVRALAARLREHIAGAGVDAAVDERSRRLDSDADALQIQTIHRSKGLEFPVVYLPYLWGAVHDEDPMPTFHGEGDGRRTVFVGGKGAAGYDDVHQRAVAERRGEDLRQAYVALTRARHQVVAWWVTTQATRHSPLARFLLAPPGQRSVADKPAAVPGDDDKIEARLREVAERSGGTIDVERVGVREPVTVDRAGVGRPVLEAARFDRALDTLWRRSSYTGITAGAHDRPGSVVGSEVERPGVTDEPADPGEDLVGAELPQSASSAGDDGELLSPMGGLPAGAAFGILVHSVLEGVDFAAADLPSAIEERVEVVLGRRRLVADDIDRLELVAGLTAVITTPLGPLAADARLADLDARDRLDELGFELPLVGGDTPGGHLRVADISDALRRWLPPDDPLAGYPDRLDGAGLDQELRGYLTGSLDLVARLPGPDGPRHVIVDYKTNRLRPARETLRVGHYRPDLLAGAMADEHYPLQAVLYSVALHRYLRWRMAGYRPEIHLGGVLYLFVRGMAGPDTPMIGGGRCGVFSWSPPAGLVAELSDRFDEGSA